ncbi:MAG: zf-TFIIB domain-containing protein [Dehalococcoidia bacterium]|nr:zf-TFIIB domain-containing protein [Dehalococcoidia bacterium]MDD5647468.1 zf-TFIIB domain-containing protein [Dehalococcoidia bacterium]
MKCPVCQISTTAVEFDKIELDYCSVCRGIWFDSGELELLMDTLTRGAARDLITSLTQKPAQNISERSRKCPICRRKMRKIDIGSGRQLLIDVCNYSHGLWFDGGEAGALIEQLKIDQPDTADPLYQALFFIRDTFQVKPATPGKS